MTVMTMTVTMTMTMTLAMGRSRSRSQSRNLPGAGKVKNDRLRQPCFYGYRYVLCLRRCEKALLTATAMMAGSNQASFTLFSGHCKILGQRERERERNSVPAWDLVWWGASRRWPPPPGRGHWPWRSRWEDRGWTAWTALGLASPYNPQFAFMWANCLGYRFQCRR